MANSLSDPISSSFWENMFEIVTTWPRSRSDTKDMAIRSYPNHRVRCVTQNLKMASTNTHDIMALRAKGIFADTIWVAIDHKADIGISAFTHRINLRRFDDPGDLHWEAWLSVKEGPRVYRLLVTYPDDAEMSLEAGLQLLRDTEPVRTSPRKKPA